MNEAKVYTVIGLMSGTSIDAIDAALIKTNGTDDIRFIDAISIPYEDNVRNMIKACFGKKDIHDPAVIKAEELSTNAHIKAVEMLLDKSGLGATDIDVVGYHGQAIFHDPAQGLTIQIGDGQKLAQATGIDVVNDFRSPDVAAGGEGAPLIPVYHQALTMMDSLAHPLAILNIGGVSNVTYIGNDDTLIAFDTGPGNALIDDCVKHHTGKDYDEEGALAKQGQVDEARIKTWLENDYFDRLPPKSLDRDHWRACKADGLSPEDAAATLTAFTVRAIAKSTSHLPEKPRVWYVTGGGRHNPVIMKGLQEVLGVPVETVEELNWRGDSMEAEGFAYMAVRALLGLPISFPGTTGCPQPMTGGTLYKTIDKAA